MVALLELEFGNYGEGEGAVATHHNELCLQLHLPLHEFPPWDAAGAKRALGILTPVVRAGLELGRFHPLLPPGLARRAVLETCDPLTFEELYRRARLITATRELQRQLYDFL